MGDRQGVGAAAAPGFSSLTDKTIEVRWRYFVTEEDGKKRSVRACLRLAIACPPMCACLLMCVRVPICMRVRACARVRVLLNLCVRVVGVHLVLWRGGGDRRRPEDKEEPQVQESIALGRCAYSVP